MMRIIIFLLLFLITPCSGFALFKPPDLILPGLDKISSIVSQGSDEEKIESLAKFYTLPIHGNLWMRQENWAPLIKLLADDSPLVRAETVRFCAKLARRGRRDGASKFIQPDSNPVVYALLVPALRLVLQDSDPDVRKEACKAIREFKDPEAVPLLDRLLDDPDPWIRFEAVFALDQLALYASPSVFNHLLDLLDTSKPWPHVLIQREALHCLQRIPLPLESGAFFFSVMKKNLTNPYLTKGVVNLLFEKFDFITPGNRGYILSLLQVRDKRIPLLVLENLQYRAPPPAMFIQTSGSAKGTACNPEPFSELIDEKGNDFDLLQQLTPLLSSNQPEIRKTVTGVIGRIQNKKATEQLISLTNDNDPEIKAKAISGLRHDKDPEIAPLLSLQVNDSNDKVRQTAIRVTASRMKKEGSGDLNTFLLSKLHDPYPPIRLDAAELLLKIKPPELLEEIIPHLPNKGMGEIFEQLIRSNDYQKVYIYRGADGSRIATTDENQAKGVSRQAKTIHNQAAENLLEYLATCKGDCSVWQKLLVGFEHEKVEPYLLELASSGAVGERVFAVQRLSAYGTERAIPTIKSLLNDTDMTLVKNAYHAIRELHYPELAPIIINKLQDPNELIRGYAAGAAGAFILNSAEMIDALMPLLNDPNDQVRVNTLLSLHYLNFPRYVETAIRMLQDSSEEVQWAALFGLRFRPPTSDSLDLLLGLIESYETEDGFHRNTELAVGVIGQIGDNAAVEPLLHLIERGLKKNNYMAAMPVVRASREALAKINSPAAMAILVRNLDSAQHRQYALEALAKMGSPTAVAPLVRHLGSTSKPPNADEAYWLLRENFSWAEIQAILKKEVDGEKLRIVFERLFPEKEEFLLRLDKLIENFKEAAAEPGTKKAQRPAISSRFVLKEKIRDGTLRLDQGQELSSLLLALLHDKDKQIVRNAAEDLAQMKDPRVLAPIKEAILAECNGNSISPILTHLIRSLHTLGGKDVIPFMVRILECPAPLASFHADWALKQYFTTEDIKAALEQDQDHEQLLKTYTLYVLPGHAHERLGKKGLKPPTVGTETNGVSSSPQRPLQLKMRAGFQETGASRLGNKASLPKPHNQSVAARSDTNPGQSKRSSAKSCEDTVTKIMVSDPEKMSEPLFSPEIILELKEQLRIGTAAMRRNAADELGDSCDLSVTESLVPFLKDNDAYVRQAASRALGKLRAEQAVQKLITLLADEDQYVQAWAAYALHRTDNSLAKEALAQYANTTGPPDRLERVNRLLSGYP